MVKKIFFLTLLLTVSAAFCADTYVDYTRGKKNNPGTAQQPMDKIARALPKLRPGDTLYILPSKTPIRDTIDIKSLAGTKDKPIVIDGMNNIFLGSRPLDTKKWTEAKPGVFTSERELASSMASRYYMIHKGCAVFMGRCTKGDKNPPFKAPEELQPGEWTIVDPEPKSRAKHNVTFYLRLAEGESTPQDGQWEEPAQISGVRIAAWCDEQNCGHKRCEGECIHAHCSNVIIRNVIVKNFWNDGFNIHGKVQNLAFENIAAVECGDDGFSAHEMAEVTAKNYVSIRNSTGICHIQQANCQHDNVYIEGSRGVDFNPCNTVCSLTNAWVRGTSARGVMLEGTQSGGVVMKNCLFVNYVPRAQFRYKKADTATGTFDKVRIHGYKKSIETSGIEKLPARTDAEGELEQKRAEFFKLFGGSLEKACGEKN